MRWWSRESAPDFVSVILIFKLENAEEISRKSPTRSFTVIIASKISFFFGGVPSFSQSLRKNDLMRFLARDVLAKSSQSAVGLLFFCVRISTVLPDFN